MLNTNFGISSISWHEQKKKITIIIYFAWKWAPKHSRYPIFFRSRNIPNVRNINLDVFVVVFLFFVFFWLVHITEYGSILHGDIPLYSNITLLRRILQDVPLCFFSFFLRGRHGRDCMVVGFTTIYAISAYHHQHCEYNSFMVFNATFNNISVISWRSVLLKE
jgi:hypothetical protein